MSERIAFGRCSAELRCARLQTGVVTAFCARLNGNAMGVESSNDGAGG